MYPLLSRTQEPSSPWRLKPLTMRVIKETVELMSRSVRWDCFPHGLAWYHQVGVVFSWYVRASTEEGTQVRAYTGPRKLPA